MASTWVWESADGRPRKINSRDARNGREAEIDENEIGEGRWLAEQGAGGRGIAGRDEKGDIIQSGDAVFALSLKRPLVQTDIGGAWLLNEGAGTMLRLGEEEWKRRLRRSGLGVAASLPDERVFRVILFHLSPLGLVRLDARGRPMDGTWLHPPDADSLEARERWPADAPMRAVVRAAMRALYALRLDVGEADVALGSDGRLAVRAVWPRMRDERQQAEALARFAGWHAANEAVEDRRLLTMRKYVQFLRQQQGQDTEIAATLTVLELPNLFALLEQVQPAGDAEATIGLATSLYSLLQALGKPRLLDRVAQVRDAAAAAPGETWNHARFQALDSKIDQQLAGGRLREALDSAEALLQRARAAGEKAYPDADYDLAMACFTLARVLKHAGGSERALPLLDEAQKRFEAVARAKAADTMASACITERGDCLRSLGRLNEAATAYEEAIRRDEQRGAERDVAVGKGQLGTVRMQQRRYKEALEAHEGTRERFTALDEPGSVAVSWHMTGMVYQRAGQSEVAEDAYLKALAIEVRLGNVAGQAGTLNQLGSLYGDVLGHSEEAVAFYRQSADKHLEIGDLANEGGARSNLADTLRKLRRLDEARQEIRRAIECDEQLGHASEPWKTWAILADIETDAGNPTAAAEAPNVTSPTGTTAGRTTTDRAGSS